MSVIYVGIAVGQLCSMHDSLTEACLSQGGIGAWFKAPESDGVPKLQMQHSAAAGLPRFKSFTVPVVPASMLKLADTQCCSMKVDLKCLDQVPSSYRQMPQTLHMLQEPYSTMLT